MLFPLQYFLLHLISPFLSPEKVSENTDNGELERQRGALREFLNTGDPRWGEKCIGPVSLIGKSEDGRTVLSLEKPGFELDGTARRGDSERVVLVKFSKEGPRNVAVAWKEDVLKRERNSKGKL